MDSSFSEQYEDTHNTCVVTPPDGGRSFYVHVGNVPYRRRDGSAVVNPKWGALNPKDNGVNV